MIKRFTFTTILIALALCLWPPSAFSQVFPGAVVTPSDLGVPTNRAHTVLTAGINTITGTIPVGDTSSFSQYAIITIGNEIMKCSSKDATHFYGCARAYDGTSTAIHLTGAGVDGNVVASYLNLMDAEVISVEDFLLNYNPVNVFSKGADPTGVSDSTAAIQAAINTSRRVYIPKGTYRVGTLNIPSSYVVIFGDGMGLTELKATGTGAVFNISAAKFVIEYLTVDANNTGNYGIYLQIGSTQGTLANVEIANATGTPGIGLANAGNAYSNLYENCLIHYNTIGVQLIKGVQNSVMRDCQVFSNTSYNVIIGDATQNIRMFTIDRGDYSTYAGAATNILVKNVQPLILRSIYTESNDVAGNDITVNDSSGGSLVASHVIVDGMYATGGNVATHSILLCDLAELSIKNSWIYDYTAAIVFPLPPGTGNYKVNYYNSTLQYVEYGIDSGRPVTGTSAATGGAGILSRSLSGVTNGTLGSIGSNNGALQLFNSAGTEKVRLHSSSNSFMGGGGLHIGGTSDPGSPNLLVDGTIIGGSVVTGTAGGTGSAGIRSLISTGSIANATMGSINANNGGLSLFLSNGTTERIRLNSNSYSWITGGLLGLGTSSPNYHIDNQDTTTLSGVTADGYAATINIVPTYDQSYNVVRHNYINFPNVALTNGATLTDAAVFRFASGAGTHKALDSGTTKTSPGTVSGWLKINVAGTIYYIPFYSSKTS